MEEKINVKIQTIQNLLEERINEIKRLEIALQISYENRKILQAQLQILTSLLPMDVHTEAKQQEAK